MLPFPSPIFGDTAPTVWHPTSLFGSGSAGWIFDPTDLSTLKQNSDQTGAVAADNDPVGFMRDITGNGHNAIQVDATKRPVLDIAGSTKSIEYNATAQTHFVFSGGNATSGWTSGTVLFAAKNITGNTGTLIGDEFGSSTMQCHYPYSDNNIYHDWLSTTRKSFVKPAGMDAWHTGDFRSAANNWRYAKDGTDVHTTASNTVGLGTSHKLGRSAHYNGFGGRIIGINRVLTGDDLVNARNWIAGTYTP